MPGPRGGSLTTTGLPDAEAKKEEAAGADEKMPAKRKAHEKAAGASPRVYDKKDAGS